MVALAWLAPITPDVIEFHCCAHPEYHGRWVNRGVMDKIETAVEDIGASYMIAQVTSPLVERIWRRLGLEVHNTIAVLHPKGD